MNSFIEKLFDEKSDYWIIKMDDISNATSTSEGSVFIASFSLPREYWDTKFKDLKISDYQKIERMYIDANICLSSPNYPPFQVGQMIGSVDRAMPIEGKHVWPLIEKVRHDGIKRDYYSLITTYDELKANDNKEAV